MTANPASSSTSAAVRAAPPGTCANDASAIECDLAASSSSPTSSAAPLTFPNATVTRAAPARSGSRGAAPASSQNATVSASQPNSTVNASRAVMITATAPSASAYPAASIGVAVLPGRAAQLANATDTGHRRAQRHHQEHPRQPVRGQAECLLAGHDLAEPPGHVEPHRPAVQRQPARGRQARRPGRARRIRQRPGPGRAA